MSFNSYITKLTALFEAPDRTVVKVRNPKTHASQTIKLNLLNNNTIFGSLYSHVIIKTHNNKLFIDGKYYPDEYFDTVMDHLWDSMGSDIPKGSEPIERTEEIDTHLNLSLQLLCFITYNHFKDRILSVIKGIKDESLVNEFQKFYNNIKTKTIELEKRDDTYRDGMEYVGRAWINEIKSPNMPYTSIISFYQKPSKKILLHIINTLGVNAKDILIEYPYKVNQYAQVSFSDFNSGVITDISTPNNEEESAKELIDDFYKKRKPPKFKKELQTKHRRGLTRSSQVGQPLEYDAPTIALQRSKERLGDNYQRKGKIINEKVE